MKAPAGLSEFVDSWAVSHKPDSGGLVTLDLALAGPAAPNLAEYLRAGFTAADPSFTTAARPTPTYAGQTGFDLTLGVPIWRNAANTAWVNSVGTGV